MTMEGNVQQQKTTQLARELMRVFNSYNKHTVQLKKNLKETNAFFREIRQNYSNACASTMSSDSLEAGRCEHMQQLHSPALYPHVTVFKTCLKHPIWMAKKNKNMHSCVLLVVVSKQKGRTNRFLLTCDFSTNT